MMFLETSIIGKNVGDAFINSTGTSGAIFIDLNIASNGKIMVNCEAF